MSNYVKSYFLTTEDSKEALCSVLNDEPDFSAMGFSI